MRPGDLAGLGETITVPVNTLSSWMKANDHRHLDILKIDVEGAEYDVLDALIAEFGDKLPITQLLVEFHYRYLEPVWENGRKRSTKNHPRHVKALRRLKKAGYKIIKNLHEDQEISFFSESAFQRGSVVSV